MAEMNEYYLKNQVANQLYMKDGDFIHEYVNGTLVSRFKAGHDVFSFNWKSGQVINDFVIGGFQSTERHLSAGSMTISGTDENIIVSDSLGRQRVVLGKQTQAGGYGISVRNSLRKEIFKLWGSEAELVGWTLAPGSMFKIDGDNKVELSSDEQFFKVTHNSNERVRLGRISDDVYGIQIKNSDGTANVFTAYGGDDASFGGFNLTNTSFHTTVGTGNTVGMQQPGSYDTTKVFFAGADDADGTNANYYMTRIGTGKIGNWLFESDSLKSAADGAAKLKLDAVNQRITTEDSSEDTLTAQGYLGGLKRGNASGTADSGSNTINAVLGDSTKDWHPVDDELYPDGELYGLTLVVEFETGNESKTISSNTSNTITVIGVYTANPSGEDYYVTYPVNNYGFWAKQGERMAIDGDVIYESGDWLIQNNATIRFYDADGDIRMWLGDRLGNKGLYIGGSISTENSYAGMSAYFREDSFKIGDVDGTGNHNYIEWDGNDLTVQGTIKLVTGETVGPGLSSKSISLQASGNIFLKALEDEGAPSTPDFIKFDCLKSNTDEAAAWEVTGDDPIIPLYADETGGDPILAGDTVYMRKGDYNTNTDVVVTVTCDEIEDSASVILLDEGAGNVQSVMSNPAHTFPASSSGVVTGSDYLNCGNTISVYEGANKLTAVGTGDTPAAGQWKCVAVGTNITPGAYTPTDGSTATDVTISDASEGVETNIHTSKIVYTISGKTTNGDNFATFTQQQSFSKSRTGADGPEVPGESAKALQLILASHTVGFDNSTGTPVLSPGSDAQDILVSCNKQNISGTPTYTILDGEGSAQDTVYFVGADDDITAETGELDASSWASPTNGESVQIKAQIGAYIDTQSVYVLFSGTTGLTGDDAVTGFLTNESHTCTVDDGVINVVGANGLFKIFEGGDDDTSNWTFTVNGTSFHNKNGCILTLTGTPANTYTITESSWTSTSVETFDITAAKAGYSSVIKTFTVAKSLQGIDGIGADAKTCILTASSYTISYDAAGANPSPSTSTDITLTAETQGFTDPYFRFTGDGITEETTWVNGTSGTTGDTFTFPVPSSYAAAPQTVTVDITEADADGPSIGVTDSITIFSVKPGLEGEDAHTSFLTNANHTVAADADGTGVGDDALDYTGAGGTFTVYDGTTDITGEGDGMEYSIPGGTDNGSFIAKTVNNLTINLYTGTGVYFLAGGGWNTVGVTFELVATHNGVVMSHFYTITKALAGTHTTGVDARTIALIPSTHVIPYDDTGAESTSVTFTTAIAGSSGTQYYGFSVDGSLNQNTTDSTYTLADGDEPAIGESVIVKVELREGADNSAVLATDSVEIFAIQDGVDARTAFLTNEAHTVSTESDGLGYGDMSAEAQGYFKVFYGTTDLTGEVDGMVYSFPGAGGSTTLQKTQNGLTCHLRTTDGLYWCAGANWTTDTETFTFVATHGGVAMERVFSMTKSIGLSDYAVRAVLTNTGLQIFESDEITLVAEFSDTITLGKVTEARVTVSPSLMTFLTTNDNTYMNLSATSIDMYRDFTIDGDVQMSHKVMEINDKLIFDPHPGSAGDGRLTNKMEVAGSLGIMNMKLKSTQWTNVEWDTVRIEGAARRGALLPNDFPDSGRAAIYLNGGFATGLNPYSSNLAIESTTTGVYGGGNGQGDTHTDCRIVMADGDGTNSKIQVGGSSHADFENPYAYISGFNVAMHRTDPAAPGTSTDYFAEATKNHNTNGYTWLPGGLLLMWGTIHIEEGTYGYAGNNNFYDVNGLSYPTQCYNVSLTMHEFGGESERWPPKVTAIDRFRFYWYSGHDTYTTGMEILWMSIGN